jgi:hypothetical protein
MIAEKNIVTTIHDIGVAEAPNDLATFSLTVKTKGGDAARGASLEDTKAQLAKQVTDIKTQLSGLQMNQGGDIVVETFNYKLEHREGGEKYAAGFQSIANISWTVVVDERLDDIYKACLKIDSNASKPFFSIKDRETLNKQALQNAIDNAKVKLDKECELLNVSRSTLLIRNWNFGYNGTLANNQAINSNYTYGMTGAQGARGVTGPQGSVGFVNAYQVTKQVGSIYQELLDYIPLVPGTVVVQVPVEINYVWKD